MGTPKKKSMAARAGAKSTIRRRRRSIGHVAKISFSLRADVVNAIKRAVRDGRAESASAFVEQAIREQLRWTRRQILHQSYAEAARDPAFSEDVDDTARAFDTAIADGLTKRRS
jgi:Arc/MetJ-type ribon-helix-helix transcriptional regulator